jgi:microcystin-dependent protein
MDAFTGEIRLLPYTFPPQNWVPCDGRALQVVNYQALYAIIGTLYGGNPPTTFNVPDLRGYAVTSATFSNSSPPGLTPYTIAHSFGQTTATASLPSHTHQMQGGVVTTAGDQNILPSPSNINVVSRTNGQADFAEATVTTSVPMALESLTVVGDNTPHSNVSPFLALQMCICVDGWWPSRP